MITSNTLLDNSSEELRMVSVLRDLIEKEDCSTIKIATGYWDIPGTSLIVSQLTTFLQKPNTKLQILIGMDPIVRTAQQKNLKYKGANTQKDFIRCDLQNLEVKDEYVDVVRLLKKYCLEDFDSSRIQIKMCKTDKDGKPQFFHAKCYIFLGEGFSKGIIGSSNFTQKGLEGNSELNYLEWSDAMVATEPKENSKTKGHNYWFEENWNKAEEWNKTFLLEVLHGTSVEKKASEVKPLTPYELYIKLLNYKFGDIVDLDQQQVIESYLPKNYEAFDYQIQAVKQCFAIMREHGGFMLADVVGLGKTIVGTLVIKHFLTMPDKDNREHKVLIITPPAIQSSWKETIEEFDKDAKNKIAPFIDFITTGSVGKLVDPIDTDDDVDIDSGDFSETLHRENYGLIMIDESHKFRNNQTNMYKSLDNLISDIGSATGLYPYIGLLSATPQNNRPSDLQSQIYLFERNETDSTLRKADGGNIQSFFAKINADYKDLIHIPKDEDGKPIKLSDKEKKLRQEKLKELSEKIRTCILEDILIRRTRTDITKYYNGKLTFPKVNGPNILEYKMGDDLANLFAQTMNIIAPDIDLNFLNNHYIRYYRYRAIEFLGNSSLKNIYKGKNMEPDRFSRQLAKIMQFNLVKRIESSFSAFRTSLENLQQYTQNMIDMWNADTIFICPDIDINAELNREKKFERTNCIYTLEDCFKDIRKKIDYLNKNGKNKNKRNREFKRANFDKNYIKLLNEDLTLIKYLCTKWNNYNYDPKLETFKKCLIPDLFNPDRNPNQKLVIFSEAKDTVSAIRNTVENVAPNLKALVITSDNRKDKEQTIRENFDANYKGEQKDDYQVIVTTEVLAEGINLHRANCILNYDTPWNSTRLMQRIGRVNRIGSTAKEVYVYNFMPSAQGDSLIQLVQKAYTKLQSFHTLFGEDSQIYTKDEQVMHYDLNIQVNGEESPMEKYICELKNYKTVHPQRFEQIVSQEKGLEIATPTQQGISYFLVRNNSISSMFVKVDKDFNARIISGVDMYNEFRTDPNDTQTIALPEDWKKRKEKAVLTVNEALAKMKVHNRNSEKATKAKEIISRMKENLQLSTQSRSLLADAYTFIQKGNIDIINKIIALDKETDNNQLSLFLMTQEEVDDVLNLEIRKIVANIQARHGKAEVYMALSK